MEWTNERALQLVERYKKHPVLWNARHPQRNSRYKKSDAWEQIACYLNLEESEVKQKMNSLLGSFRREKAKRRKAIGTGKGREKTYKSNWFAFDKMQYLIDKDKPIYTTDTENINDETQSASAEDISSQNSDSDTSDGVEIPHQSDLKNTRTRFNDSVPRKSKKAKMTSNYEEHGSEEPCKPVKKAAGTPEIPQDECSIYGQYVANKLRHYTRRTRIEVEYAFNNILYDADIGKYDWSVPNPVTQDVNNLPYHHHATAPFLSPHSFLKLYNYGSNSMLPHSTSSTPNINSTPPYTCPIPIQDSTRLTCASTNVSLSDLPLFINSSPLHSTCQNLDSTLLNSNNPTTNSPLLDIPPNTNSSPHPTCQTPNLDSTLLNSNYPTTNSPLLEYPLITNSSPSHSTSPIPNVDSTPLHSTCPTANLPLSDMSPNENSSLSQSSCLSQNRECTPLYSTCSTILHSPIFDMSPNKNSSPTQSTCLSPNRECTPLYSTCSTILHSPIFDMSPTKNSSKTQSTCLSPNRECTPLYSTCSTIPHSPIFDISPNKNSSPSQSTCRSPNRECTPLFSTFSAILTSPILDMSPNKNSSPSHSTCLTPNSTLLSSTCRTPNSPIVCTPDIDLNILDLIV